MIKKVFKKCLKLLAKQVPGAQLRVLMLRLCGYDVGRQVYIGEDLIIIDEPEDKGNVVIEDCATISPRVTLITSSYPNFSRIRPYVPTAQGPIAIGESAWLGAGVIVLPNVTIGQGAVIGAGSVVTSDVAPYMIVAGVPAKPLRSIVVPKDLHCSGTR